MTTENLNEIIALTEEELKLANTEDCSEFERVHEDVRFYRATTMDEGDTIVGKLIKIGISGEYGNKVYHLLTKNGEAALFGTVALDRLMTKINMGQMIAITYDGYRFHEGKTIHKWLLSKEK